MIETESRLELDHRPAATPAGGIPRHLGQTLYELWIRRPLTVVSLLYLGLWTSLSIWHSVPFASIETDGMEYIATARSLLTPTFSFSSFHGLGYPVAIWLAHLVVPDWFQAAKVVSGLAGLVFILASYRIVERLFGSYSALITVLLVLSNLFFIAYTAIAMSDMLGAALGLSALWVLLCAHSAGRYPVAGLLVGLAAATRYQYLGLILVGLLVWLLEANPRARISAVVLYLGVFALAAAPGLLVNWKAFGNPLSSNFANLGPWFYSAPETARVDSWQAALSVVASRPLYFASGYLKAITFDLPIYLGHVVFYAVFFAVPGWILAVQDQEDLNSRLLALAFLAAYVLVTGLTWMTEPRFWLLAIPFTAAGCAFLVVWLNANHRRTGTLVLLVLLAANGAGAAANWSHFASEQAPEFQRAGQALYAGATNDATILVSQPQIAYFAGRPAVLLRDVPQTWDTLPRVLADHKIQYIVMDERYGSYHYPGLNSLLDGGAVSRAFPNWQLLYEERQSPRIVVYRVLP